MALGFEFRVFCKVRVLVLRLVVGGARATITYSFSQKTENRKQKTALIPGAVGAGAQLLEDFGHVGHDVGEFLGLGGGNPLEAEALGFQSEVLQHEIDAFGPALCFDITFQVMTFAQVSPADQDTVGALGERVDDQVGVHHAGAHYPDDAAVGGVLNSRDAGQVGAGIRAPVAEKSDDQRFELIFHVCDPLHEKFKVQSSTFNVQRSKTRVGCGLGPDPRTGEDACATTNSSIKQTRFKNPENLVGRAHPPYLTNPP